MPLILTQSLPPFRHMHSLPNIVVIVCENANATLEILTTNLPFLCRQFMIAGKRTPSSSLGMLSNSGVATTTWPSG